MGIFFKGDIFNEIFFNWDNLNTGYFESKIRLTGIV